MTARGGRRDNHKRRPDDKRGGVRVGAGRKPASVTIAVSLESAATAQQLILHFPGVSTVEALYEYALTKLAEHTGDEPTPAAPPTP